MPRHGFPAALLVAAVGLGVWFVAGHGTRAGAPASPTPSALQGRTPAPQPGLAGADAPHGALQDGTATATTRAPATPDAGVGPTVALRFEGTGPRPKRVALEFDHGRDLDHGIAVFSSLASGSWTVSLRDFVPPLEPKEVTVVEGEETVVDFEVE